MSNVGGVFDVRGNATLRIRGGDFVGGTLNNTGAVRVSDGGSINVDQSTNLVNGTLTGGTWNLYSGSSLQIGNGNISRIAADTFVRLEGALSQFDQLNALSQNAGTLFIRNSATFAISGISNDVTGRIQNEVNGKINNIGYFRNDGYLRNILYSTLNNSGIINNNSGTIINGFSSTLINSGTLQNRAELQNGAGLTNVISNTGNLTTYSGGMLTNGGTLNNSNLLRNFGTQTNGGVINNSAGTFMNGGLFTNNAPVNNYASLWNLTSGTILNYGNLNNIGGVAAIQNDGVLVNHGVVTGGSLNNTGTVSVVSGGSINVAQSANFVNGTLSGGSWEVIGTTATASLQIGTGNITTLAAGTSVTLAGAYSQFDQLNALNQNAGSLTIRDNINNAYGLSKISGAFTNTGALTVGIAGFVQNAGTLQNASNGVVTTDVGGILFTYGTLTNSGTLNSSGSLFNTGTLQNQTGGIIRNQTGGNISQIFFGSFGTIENQVQQHLNKSSESKEEHSTMPDQYLLITVAT